MLDQGLLNWKPVALPRREPMQGRTVTLVPLDAERDAAPLWQAIQGRVELWDWLSEGPFASEADLARDLAQKQSAADRVYFAIVPTAIEHAGGAQAPGAAVHSGNAQGYVSYLRMDPAHGVIEVGNILFTHALQRSTAATEAMYLMARHIFDDLDYRRYEWKCNALNQPSRRAALRLGFTFEGIFRQHMVIKDRNRDTAWFAMLDSEWPARRAALQSWLDPVNFDAEGCQRRSLSEIQTGK